MGKANKLNYDIIKEYINSDITGNGCSIITSKEDFELEKEKSSKASGRIKIEIQCSCGETFITDFNNFKSYNKKQCNKCGKLLMIDKKTLNYLDVKNFIDIESKSGCKLISTEYSNAKDDIKVQCKCGEVYNVPFARFKYANQRECPKCSHIRRIAERSCTYEEVKNYVEVESNSGCTLLSKEYFGVLINIKIQCKCGEIFYTSFATFLNKNKHQCDKCSEIKKKLDCLEKYGVENPMQRQEIKDKVAKTNMERYGFTSAVQSPEIREKIRQTFYKNGTTPCSKQQEYIHNILCGQLNYPVKTSSLDIAFPDEMIYLEYDGSGHKMSVIFGTFTEEEFIKRERNRTYGLLRSGWKEIRIISTNDLLPSDQIILEILSYARTYLKIHHYIKFDIDNNKIINSQGEFNFDYGELRKIKLTDLKEAI